MSTSVHHRDEELLRLIALGDEQALGALYDRYACLVFSIALHVTGDQRCAETVTEDVFHQVWTQASACRWLTGLPGSWLIGLARDRAIAMSCSSHTNGGRRQMRLDNRSQREKQDGADDEHAALRCTVRAALATLSYEQRHALELTYFHGLTAGEIASMAALPVSTVTSRLHSGLTTLRDALRHGAGRTTSEALPWEQQM